MTKLYYITFMGQFVYTFMAGITFMTFITFMCDTGGMTLNREKMKRWVYEGMGLNEGKKEDGLTRDRKTAQTLEFCVFVLYLAIIYQETVSCIHSYFRVLT